MARIKIEDLNVETELANNEMGNLFGGLSVWPVRRSGGLGLRPRLAQRPNFGSMNSVLGVSQSPYQPFNRLFQTDEEEEVQA